MDNSPLAGGRERGYNVAVGAERILVVDDEPGWLALVEHWLNYHGYTNLQLVDSGAKAIEAAQKTPPECILLDLVLPDQSGLEVCRVLRGLPALTRVPVVLLTSHKREKVLGLQNGADYFVSKSEDPGELLATLQAVFRRKELEEGLLVRRDLTLRERDRKVFWNGVEAATLTPKMFTLLHVLVQRAPQPVGRDQLHRLLEGEENTGLSRALDVMLNRLRKALPPVLAARIVNVKSFGYVFIDEEHGPSAPPPAV